MNRRDFFLRAFATGGGIWLAGCGRDENGVLIPHRILADRATVTLYDTNAMALYGDGGLGPKTGVIKVDYILADKPVTLEFWHGHGGKNHQFTLLPAHYADLKKLKKVTIETTNMASHTHNLFIDPVDPKWRVAGAQPVQVPVPDSRIG